MPNYPTVFLVDPDARFVHSCGNLFKPHDIDVQAFDSPHDFFVHSNPTKLGCIVSELQFSGENGIDFTRRLKEQGWTLPILIHTAYGDVSSCSRAFHAGVSDFLEKTVPPDMLLDRVLDILSKCRQDHALWLIKQSLSSKMSRLTDREREVARALVSGQAMKEIASEFGTSFQSVARHRQRILLKLEVENDVALANLIRGLNAWQSKLEPEFDNSMAIVHD